MEKNKHHFLVEALYSLCPTALWVLRGDSYDEIEWQDSVELQPSKDEVDAEVLRLANLWKNTEYQRLRAPDYPSITDQLDALWKGGAAAEEMLARVQAVKSQYPKPEGM